MDLMLTPRKGSVARCSLGALGLITKNKRMKIVYPDGEEGFAYVGIHLTDRIAPIGSPWSSRNPLVLAHLEEIENGGLRMSWRDVREVNLCSV